MPIANIAAYKFITVPEPKSLVEPLLARCRALDLKGTVVLAEEGINLFLAGAEDNIKAVLEYLAHDELFDGRFAALDVKYSWSDDQPFKKMVVRVAREIITMRHPLIQPEDNRAPAVDALTLKNWLDQGHDDNGRPVVLMDTRNAFEVAMGTFDKAVEFDIQRFSEFPDAVKQLCEDTELKLKEKTIVSFCTGGIRCEKAALYLKEIDVEHVYQLDGGILRYFEEAGGAHWTGECFVFDERVAVDTKLQPTEKFYEGRTLGERPESVS
jgi:UPF0176 protein